SLDIGGAHEDFARQPIARTNGRDGDTVLAGPRLGDDPGLAHPPREQDLPEAVVDLMAAGVVELVALEVNFRAAFLPVPGSHLAQMRRQALGMIERRWTSRIMRVEGFQLGLKLRVVLCFRVSALEIEDQRHQRLGDEPAAEDPEEAVIVRSHAEAVGPRNGSRFDIATHALSLLTSAGANAS